MTTAYITTPMMYREPRTVVRPIPEHICFYVPTLIGEHFAFMCNDADCGNELPYHDGLRRLNVAPDSL